MSHDCDLINDIGVEYLDWDIIDKIHGNGLPNVRRNMERLINFNFMISTFRMMDEVLYNFLQGWPTKVGL